MLYHLVCKGGVELRVRILSAFLPIIIAFWITGSVEARESDTYISEIAQEACIEYGQEYEICPELLMAIIETESCGQPDVENGGCYGLMQISKKWHKDRMKRLSVRDIYDERGNILVGTDYLAELRNEYHELSLVLDIYHGDSKAFENYENGIISDYATAILERSAELEGFYD